MYSKVPPVGEVSRTSWLSWSNSSAMPTPKTLPPVKSQSQSSWNSYLE